jgi:hypothetical protein
MCVRKFTDSFIDNAAILIQEGWLLKDVAIKLGCSSDGLGRYLGLRGVVIKHQVPSGNNRIDDLPEQEIIKMFLSGSSVKYLARQFNISRDPIKRILIKNNVSVRNRSEGMFVRMAQASPEERKKLTDDAHKASRNRTVGSRRKSAMLSAINAEKKMVPRGSCFGTGENEIANFLRERGYNVIQQKALDIYSIDMVIGSIAVEVRLGSYNWSDPKVIARFKHIIESGYKVIVISFSEESIVADSLNDIVTHLDFINSNPAPVGQYWVIRCGLQLPPIYRDDLGRFAGVDAPKKLVTSIREVNLGLA